MTLEKIGNTELHRIQSEKINPYKNTIPIFVKLESQNPTKSIKDRMVYHIVSKAKKQASEQITFVSASSGNTGSSLAYICKLLNLECIVVTNTKCSEEKIKACRDYGAEVIIGDSEAPPDSDEHYQNIAANLAKSNPNYFDLNQYDNESNTETYFQTLGPEIWEQTEGKITHFVTGGSTCGTITGVGRFLKEKNKEITLVLADPIGSSISSFVMGREVVSELGSYVIEGVGKDSAPKLLDRTIINSVIAISDQEAIDMCHKLNSEEDLHLGGSSGLNVSAAVRLASKLSPESNPIIVTIGCDSGEKYESKIYNDVWLRENNFS
jgi:cysteine synthase